MLLATNIVFSQENPNNEKELKAAVTLGILQGGGSLIGADFEFLAPDRLGIQIGAGIIGFGPSLNYHLKPTVCSPMLWLKYWHQGVVDSFS